MPRHSAKKSGDENEELNRVLSWYKSRMDGRGEFLQIKKINNFQIQEA